MFKRLSKLSLSAAALVLVAAPIGTVSAASAATGGQASATTVVQSNTGGLPCC